MAATIFAHPRSPVQFDPPPSDPREQAVLHDEDICSGCGCPTVDHFGGCALALGHKQTSWPMGVLYGDPHLDVTRAISLALATSCGPAVAVFFDTLGADEALMFARQLSRVAVSAHLAELAK